MPQFPGLAPWAGIFRPFRAAEIRVQIRISLFRKIRVLIKGAPI
jgi:hypothetical protein